MNDASLTLTLNSRDEAVLLFGPRDQNLRAIKEALGVRLIARGDMIQIDGGEDRVGQADRVFHQLRQLLHQQGKLKPDDVRTVLDIVQHGGDRVGPDNLASVEGGRHIRPRTDGQARYVRAMRENDLTLCVGPAGTGKTFLAVGMAVTMLQARQIKKIVLVRPAVEAGERLGFLPGDIVAKINPYLRPLFDALNDMLDPDAAKRYMDNDIIEICPLAFMRGRAQPLTSQVLTPTGYRPIGMLRAGDLVISSNGAATMVRGVFPQGPRPVYRVAFSDGSCTRCCGEHLWTVYTRYNNQRHRRTGPHVLQTHDMIGRLWSGYKHRYELPVLSRPVAFPAREVPLDPYALGLLLGDGCFTGSAATPSFVSADPELAAALGEGPPGIRVHQVRKIDYQLTKTIPRQGPKANPLTLVLRELGLWGTYAHTKRVPESYLHNTPAVRLAVLQGLLDTDGCAVIQPKSCRVQYTTVSAQLRDDVLFLVRSLGGVASSHTRYASESKPGRAHGKPVINRKDAFILDIRLPEWAQPFRLKRKAERYEAVGGTRPVRYVHQIEPDGFEETVCIAVAAEDSLYVTDDFILTHNTLNQSAIILDEGQNSTVPQMKMLLTRMGNGSKIIVTGDVTQVDLPKQTRSGLVDAVHRLRNIDRVAIVHLHKEDIVRHPLVQQIVLAYEEEKPARKKE